MLLSTAVKNHILGKSYLKSDVSTSNEDESYSTTPDNEVVLFSRTRDKNLLRKSNYNYILRLS